MLDIERQAMQMLLAGDHPALETLRQQFEQCHVLARDITDVGFFATFEVRRDAPRIHSRQRLVIGDVCADVERLADGCGFLLFVDDGLLQMLECHLWGGDSLPPNARYTRFYYVHRRPPPRVTKTQKRDVEALHSLLEM